MHAIKLKTHNAPENMQRQRSADRESREREKAKSDENKKKTPKFAKLANYTFIGRIKDVKVNKDIKFTNLKWLKFNSMNA